MERPGDGLVMKGGWKAADGLVRFYLSDGIEVWRKHVGAYGLNYLDDIPRARGE